MPMHFVLQFYNEMHYYVLFVGTYACMDMKKTFLLTLEYTTGFV